MRELGFPSGFRGSRVTSSDKEEVVSEGWLETMRGRKALRRVKEEPRQVMAIMVRSEAARKMVGVTKMKRMHARDPV